MKVVGARLRGTDGEDVRFVKTGNMGGKLQGGQPRYLVIHYTAGANASGAIKTFQNGEPGKRTSAHLVVDHDGSIAQMVPFDTVAWHAGASRWKGDDGLNACSIGIEIANWGKLEQHADGSWMSWTGKARVPKERVVLAEHKNALGTVHGWEMFDEEQYEATIAAARAIVAAYKMEPWDLVGHDDISPVRKIDPGPAFNMDRFRARVFGREVDTWNDTLFRVSSPSGLNMRIGPGIGEKTIKNLPDGTMVHLIQKTGVWWMVAEVVGGNDDTTGYVHSHWLMPV
ncbi:MAG TPA: N-acetylmuramoyl-L-alanine amidase [Microvirga sp.]|jgi:N-acetylmuramoyl-L-alanine amidase|nr:N-acetylmuramoyl-L-alanine amidase [Microvirga sp.]